jgi:hypothetical protein
VKRLAVRVLALAALAVFLLAASEGSLRCAARGVLPQVGCWRDDAFRLEPGCVQRVRGGERGSWTLRADADGFRRGEGRGPWLLVGDSQVFAQGVEEGETAAAVATRAGVGVRAVGLPGFGVVEALAAAAASLGGVRGLVLAVDPANDWRDALLPMERRYLRVGGWLLQSSWEGSWSARVLASPLGRSQVVVQGLRLLAARRAADPRALRLFESPWGLSPEERGRAEAGMTGAIRAFAAAHPGLDLRVLLLPLDFATGEARAREVLAEEGLALRPWEDRALWAGLRTDLPPLPVLDASALPWQPRDFQAGDFHLSIAGQARLGAFLAAELAGRAPAGGVE